MLSLWKAIYLGRVYFIVQFVCICIWAFVSVVIGFERERAVFVKCLAKCLSSCYRKRWVTSVAIMFLSFIVLLTSIFSISLFVYTIYVLIVYSSSHTSPTHKQGQNGSINWISIRHGAVATWNRSICVYFSVLSRNTLLTCLPPDHRPTEHQPRSVFTLQLNSSALQTH